MMMALPASSWPVTIRRMTSGMGYISGGSGVECFGDPVGDERAPIGHVVDADVFDSTGAGVENLQLALGAVDQLIVGLMRVGDGNLPVIRAMSDQERHADAVQHAVEIH